MSSKTLRWLLIGAIGLAFLQPVSTWAQQLLPAKDKSKTSGAPGPFARFRSGDIRRGGNLQDLPRGYLQRLGEKPSLEDRRTKKAASRSRAAKIATVPVQRTSQGGGDITKIFAFKKALHQGNQRPLPDLPRGRHAAHERHQLGALARMTSVASPAIRRTTRNESEFLLVKVAARALLHMPPQQKGPVRYAVPSSSERRADPVQRLPQSCTARWARSRCALPPRRMRSASNATPTSRGRLCSSMRP